MVDVDFRSVLEYCEMGLYDSINYVLFKNPVSSTVIDSVKSVANSSVFRGSSTQNASVPKPIKIPPELEKLPVARVVLSGTPVIRLAGISGALAVIFGAYGAHMFYVKETSEDRKRIYETANRYHFIHTLALFGVPLTRHPNLTGSIITMGMLLFCGAGYYDAFTGDTSLRRVTPIGGTLLIIGWLSMVF